MPRAFLDMRALEAEKGVELRLCAADLWLGIQLTRERVLEVAHGLARLAAADGAIHLDAASVLRMETSANPEWMMTVETTAEE